MTRAEIAQTLVSLSGISPPDATALVNRLYDAAGVDRNTDKLPKNMQGQPQNKAVKNSNDLAARHRSTEQ